MIVIAKPYGRMANQMWLYTHFLGFAQSHNLRVMNPAFWRYAHFFEGTSGQLLSAWPKKKSLFCWLGCGFRWLFFVFFLAVYYKLIILKRLFGVERLWGFQLVTQSGAKEINLAQSKSRFLAPMTFVSGWLFRDNVNVNRNKELILQFFKPIPALAEQVSNFIIERRRVWEIVVGVHIRRGDYARHEAGQYFYSDTRYLILMQQVAQLMPGKNVGFIICSDEEISLSAFSALDCCIAPGHPVVDLYTLAQCDYIMGPPSTYSIWASFYGDVPLYQITKLKLQVPLQLESFKLTEC